MKINKKFIAPFYPFAGIAVAWYCFMPNIELLTGTGVYRSQLLIHTSGLVQELGNIWRYVSQPKTYDWKLCRNKYLKEHLAKTSEFQENIPFGERYKNKEYMELMQIDLPTYLDSKCGDKPKEGTR